MIERIEANQKKIIDTIMKNFLDLKECFNPSNKNPYTVCRTRYTSALAGLIRNLKLAGGWCNEKTGIHYNPQHSLGDW